MSKSKKYRLHTWLNTKTMLPEYGIQGKIDKTWFNCSENNKPLIFPYIEEANEKIESLNNSDCVGTLVLPVVKNSFEEI